MVRCGPMTIYGPCDWTKVTCVTSAAEDGNAGVKPPILAGHCCDQGFFKFQSINRSYNNFISISEERIVTV